MLLAEASLILLGCLFVIWTLGRYVRRGRWDSLIAIGSGSAISSLFYFSYDWDAPICWFIGILVTVGVRALINGATE